MLAVVTPGIGNQAVPGKAMAGGRGVPEWQFVIDLCLPHHVTLRKY